jgi:hypothetical protein
MNTGIINRDRVSRWVFLRVFRGVIFPSERLSSTMVHTAAFPNAPPSATNAKAVPDLFTAMEGTSDAMADDDEKPAVGPGSGLEETVEATCEIKDCRGGPHENPSRFDSLTPK